MILDTNAVSDLFSGHAGLARLLAPDQRHHLPSIVLGEYRFGLIASRRRRRLEILLDQLETESYVLVPDSRTARAYAEVRYELKKQGTPIPENDVWIAALTRQHDLPLVSRDTHFDQVRDLIRFDWS